jgi:phage terminase large subunit-like protein
VDMNVYDEGNGPIDLEAHARFKDPCWIGVDLGWNDDLSAVVVAWPDREGRETGYDVWPFVFCPEAKVQKRGNEESAKYKEWSESEDGFLTATPGDATDYTAIRELIETLCDRFNVQEVAFDPKFASEMMSALLEKGIPAVAMQQGWITMAPAIKELHRAVISRRFNHGGHPVMRWNFENVVVHKDSAGNQTFHKGKSKDKIDVAQAAAMAVGRAFEGSKVEKPPIPFYMQPGFDASEALGVADGDDPAADDAELDARIRAMLEDD